MILSIFFMIVVLVILWVGIVYNSFVYSKNQILEAWSGINVQLKLRYELIPNLVETVKGYQRHENSTLIQITTLRTQAMSAQNITEKTQAEANLSLGMSKLFAIAENYPELKANTNFADLQNTLRIIEDNIQHARRYYNGVTRDYNYKIQSFPNNIIAMLFHFTTNEFFQSDHEKAEKTVPQITF